VVGEREWNLQLCRRKGKNYFSGNTTHSRKRKCETARQTGVGGTGGKVAVLCMDLLALLARIPSLAHSFALVPYLTLSVSLAFPVLVRLLQHSTLWFITSSWLQHGRHLKDGLSN